jgi:hypothetical protein
MKKLKAVSYSAKVDWGTLVNSAWIAGFLSGLTLGVMVMMAIYYLYK